MFVQRWTNALLTGLLIGTALASGQPKPLIDLGDDELLQRVPELKGTRFDHDPRLVESVLRPALESVNKSFDRFGDLSAAEVISEVRLDWGGALVRTQSEHFRYTASMPRDSLDVRESRLSTTDGKSAAAGKDGFAVGDRFIALMELLLPELADRLRLRTVGHTNGAVAFVFATDPGASSGPRDAGGVIWVDASRAQPVRMLCELAIGGQLRIDLTLANVRFDSLDATLLLPALARFDTSREAVRGHAVHRFSDYRLDRHTETGQFAAIAAGSDALELLGQGAALSETGNTAASITALREALRLDDSLAPAHHHLARALRSTGDKAGAESEARLALKGMDGISAAHNFLGILLIERGAAAEAVPVLREAVRLAPGDATANANLTRALDKGSDHAAETIRVDVREVLVPAVVFDHYGRTIDGLRQSDFRVLEDGVEQKITSFHAEVPGAASQASQNTSPRGPRHSYLFVLDALHSRVGNLREARDVLRKFFASESAEDSQYGVVSIGQTINVIQNMTRDPAVVLAALDDKAFLKITSGGRGESAAAEKRQFEQDLARVRAESDSGTSRLAAGEARLLAVDRAVTIESEERNSTVAFLSALRNLVLEMAKGRQHRTLILISDGFQLSPGRIVAQLLAAYGLPWGLGMRPWERLDTEFEDVVKIAARSNIVIDTIDSRGLYSDSSLDAEMSGSPQSVAATVASTHRSLEAEAGLVLGEFAGATGGTAYGNSNDLLASLRKATVEGRDYYTLGYVSSNAALDGKFRRITVEVTGRKVNLRAKRGYWAAAN